MPETQPVQLIEGSNRRQLGVVRPANTTAVSVYSPGNNLIAIVDAIWICNQTGTAATYRLFHDDDGTTYDQTTALVYDTSLAANATIIIDEPIYMNNPNGNLGVRTGTNSALTFIVYGRELNG